MKINIPKDQLFKSAETDKEKESPLFNLKGGILTDNTRDCWRPNRSIDEHGQDHKNSKKI